MWTFKPHVSIFLSLRPAAKYSPKPPNETKHLHKILLRYFYFDIDMIFFGSFATEPLPVWLYIMTHIQTN